MTGKIQFSQAASLFEYYGLAPVEEIEITPELFSDEEFRCFFRDAMDAQLVSRVECEGVKIYPWHSRNSFFVEEVGCDSTETPMGADEWRPRGTRTVTKWLAPVEYIPAIFAGRNVYATPDWGRTKMLVMPQ